MSLFQKHPFGIQAHFRRSLVLTYAISVEDARRLVPEALELDLYKNRYAFCAVAFVDTRGLRPKKLPNFFGRDFQLIGFRIFVRYRGLDGRRRRGLYILGSMTNKLSMAIMGNWLTAYKYENSGIFWKEEGEQLSVKSDNGIDVRITKGCDAPRLPEKTPFPDWRTARQFAGPMPFTFSVQGNSVCVVEGVRSEWKPQPVEVVDAFVPQLIERWALNDACLANAFIVENVDYEWRRGVYE